MKKRLITGAVYVLVMVGLLVMKLLIPVTDQGLDYGAIGIDVLFWLISVIGAYEFLRAVGEVSTAQKWVALLTCALVIPSFVGAKMIAAALGADLPGGSALIALLAVGSLGAMIVASLTVFDHEKSNFKSTAYAEMCILYCGALTSVCANVNHLMANSRPAILLLFIIVPFVDTGAFLFGKMFGKLLPRKLAPSTSPNKTVIGGVGGILGGIVASVLTWVICEYSGCAALTYSGSVPTVVIFILISLPTAILGQLGDLFESAIKRSCGIKDMGKILPGHGGVLDRFDSMLFASVAIVVCFMVVK